MLMMSKNGDNDREREKKTSDSIERDGGLLEASYRKDEFIIIILSFGNQWMRFKLTELNLNLWRKGGVSMKENSLICEQMEIDHWDNQSCHLDTMLMMKPFTEGSKLSAQNFSSSSSTSSAPSFHCQLVSLCFTLVYIKSRRRLVEISS